MSRVDRNPVSSFRADPQVRKTFDEGELRRLGASLKKKQIHPVVAKKDGTLLDGERRWRAAVLVGLETLDVIIVEEDLTPAEVTELQLVSAFHRADLTGYEKWQGCLKLLELHPDWQAKDLAAHLNVDPSMVPRLMAASNTVPEVQEAFKAGAVNAAQVYALCKAGPEEQRKMLAAALNGASRDQLESAGRKARNGHATTVKTARVKAPLPSGIEVIISGSGKEVGLDEVIESLTALLKEAKKANDSGLDVKTWSAVLRDRAKAGKCPA